jgi:hypothetical protein
MTMSNPSNTTAPIDTSRERVDADLPPLPELPETNYVLAVEARPYESEYITGLEGWDEFNVREYARAYAAAAVAAERERWARLLGEVVQPMRDAAARLDGYTWRGNEPISKPDLRTIADKVEDAIRGSKE